MSRRDYFDEVAHLWDGWNEREDMGLRLREGLRALGVGPDERIVDLGSGTGILTGHLLELLGEEGRIVAVDFSPRMHEIAARKIADPRVRFELAEAARLPLDDASVDRVLCFSTWPHFPDPVAVLEEAWRALKPGGPLHVWHLASRETINSIHRGVGGVIAEDLLAPASELARMGREAGFAVETQLDEPDRYLVSLAKVP